MRLAGKMKLGFYPLPVTEADRIRRFLRFPEGPCAAIDPCVGDGVAFARLTSTAPVLRYGIELDAYRAEQARERAEEILHGDALETQCPVESFSLLYLNPPYDQESGPGQNQRMEQVFLRHTCRWLKPAGVLVLVIPVERLAECGQILATQFGGTRVYRLTESTCVCYKQVVVMTIRRSRRERERLQDSDITRRRLRYASLARDISQLAGLPSEPDAEYLIPESGPVQMVYRGLPLDEIEDLLPRSSAYRQASRVLFAPPSRIEGRPLTPLHSGHIALLAVSSLLDGIVGSGESRHIAAWRSVKSCSCTTEEEEDGTIIQREREYYTNELTLTYADGRTAILK
jgi:Uncharacterised methyltransferase family (DUF6094)